MNIIPLSLWDVEDPSSKKWTRNCPSCGTTLFYTYKHSMLKQEKENASCRSCTQAQKPNTGFAESIKSAHALGLSNRGIARYVGCHHSTVRHHMNKLGLPANIPRGKPPIETSETKAICSSCGTEILKVDFALIRSHTDGRRLSICRKCRREQEYTRISNNPSVYLRNKECKARVRAKKVGLPFTLPDGYIEEIYRRQNGRCFYTDTILTLTVGKGRIPTTLSIDRVDSRRGYEPDNVVLCTDRVNSIKKDTTFDEMANWMPGWYQRVIAAERAGYITVRKYQQEVS